MKNKQHNQNQLLNKNLLTRTGAYKKKNKKDSSRTFPSPKVVFTPKTFKEIVPKLHYESQRQYEILKRYCQENSLVQLSKRLKSLLNSDKCPKTLLNNRGRLASLRTLERWSKKFDWVERKDAWVHEECERLYYSFTQSTHKRQSSLMTVKYHQMTPEIPPDLAAERGQKSVDEFTLGENDSNSSLDRDKSGQKKAVKGNQGRSKATKIEDQRDNYKDRKTYEQK